MLRRELLIGYLVAGVLAVAVPSSAYDVAFLSGHGALTELENVIVGPLVAFISFVCPIGNVPLAAALFKGGLSFGGTVAFVFADLITVPLVVIYGKFYGRRLALRLFFSFWAVMSAAGLVTDLLFRALRIPAPGRAPVIAATHFQWNCTTHLNIVFLVVAVVVSWMYRNRARFGDDGGYAKDMVCGMQVERAHAPATHVHDGRSYYFCSDRCEEKFVKEPAKYLADPGAAPMGEHASRAARAVRTWRRAATRPSTRCAAWTWTGLTRPRPMSTAGLRTTSAPKAVTMRSPGVLPATCRAVAWRRLTAAGRPRQADRSGRWKGAGSAPPPSSAVPTCRPTLHRLSPALLAFALAMLQWTTSSSRSTFRWLVTGAPAEEKRLG